MITVKLTDTKESINLGYPDVYNTEDATWDVLCNNNAEIEYNSETDTYTATKKEAKWWEEYFIADEKCQEAFRNANLTGKELEYYYSELNCDVGDQPTRGLTAINLLISQRK